MTWFVLLALPLQGVAGVTMFMGQPAVASVEQHAGMAVMHDHCHAGMPMSEMAAAAPAKPVKTAKAEAGKSCTTCTVCCTALATQPQINLLPQVSHHAPAYTGHSTLAVQFLTDGPERPPRLPFLA